MDNENVIEQHSVVRVLLTAILYVTCCSIGLGQKQLVVLKRGEVVKYYDPGDDFVFKQKGVEGIRSTYVNNLSDTSIVTHRDTVAFHKIERIYFQQHSFHNTVGAFLVIGGTGYFLVDQINNVLVNGNKPQFDSDINNVSIPLIAIGLPLILTRKKSQRIGYRYRILTVTKESPLYRNSPQRFLPGN